MRSAGLIVIALLGACSTAGATTLPPFKGEPLAPAAASAVSPKPEATQSERNYFQASGNAANEIRAISATWFSLEQRRTGARY